MSEMTRVVLRRNPDGMPVPDDFELQEQPMPEAAEGEVLVRTIYLSLDPYMRGGMSDRARLGHTPRGGIVGQAIASRAEAVKPGDFVSQYVGGSIGWSSHGAAPASELRVLDPDLVPLSTALGIVGMPGVTAYFGLLDVGQPAAGETVVVSAATGAVGAVVGQLAKMKGCRAVGIAGSDEKCRYAIEELGFDAMVNHRGEDVAGALRAACPDGIDVYFDNVGGPVFEVVIEQLNRGARVPLCGSIAEYNMPLGARRGPSINRIVQGNLVRMQGFNQGQYTDRHEEALALLASWVRSGKLKYKEDIVDGLERAPEAFIGMLQGKNLGKLLVRVGED